jgi:hypothetical protein
VSSLGYTGRHLRYDDTNPEAEKQVGVWGLSQAAAILLPAGANKQVVASDPGSGISGAQRE